MALHLAFDFLFHSIQYTQARYRASIKCLWHEASGLVNIEFVQILQHGDVLQRITIDDDKVSD
jgi:hypothetical protein